MYIFKKWRLWTALIIFIFCIFAIKPNFDTSNKLNKINYGLDIQGGYSFLLELSEKTFETNLLLKSFFE